MKITQFPHPKYSHFIFLIFLGFYQISIGQILPELTQGDSFQKILPFIDAKLDAFFKERLVQKMPIISMFIGDKTIAQLKEVFLEELAQIFPALLSEFTQSTANAFLLNIETKWSKKLETYLLKATQKIRIIAFFLGLIWGFMIQFILTAV